MDPTENGTRYRVLCADDDPTTVAAIMAGLGRRGWSVSSAADSMQAMMFAVQGRPDVIVLDLRMPGGDGTHVLRRLKKSVRTVAIPVVVLSGSNDPRAPARALRLGAKAYLPKPVDIDLLESTLEAAMGLSEPPPDVVMAPAPAAAGDAAPEATGDAAPEAEEPDAPAGADAAPDEDADPTR